jgi:uncharacterized protein (TIGR03067 family)
MESGDRSNKAKGLQGKWRIVVFDFKGQWLSVQGPVGEYYRSLKVTLSDTRISIKRDKDTKPAPAGIEFIWDHGYKVDGSKQPGEIEIRLLVFSPKGEATESGRVWRGIYELHEDQLVMCIDTKEPSESPREFANVKGREHIIMLLRREKEE